MDRCIEASEIESVLAGDPQSPTRRHLETCPCCRALLMGYWEFLGDRSIPAEAEAADAEQRLRASFDAELRPRVVSFPRRPAPLLSWMRSLHPGWAIATVVLVVAGIYGGVELFNAQVDFSQVRGPARPGPAAPEDVIALHPALWLGDGSLWIEWQPVSGAESYSIRLIAPDLSVLARLGPVTGTQIVVGPEVLNALPGSPGLLGIQVVALAAGTPIVTSSIETVRRP